MIRNIKKQWLIIAVTAVLVVVAVMLYTSSRMSQLLNRPYELKDFPQVQGTAEYQIVVDGLNKSREKILSKPEDQVVLYDLWNDVGVRKLALNDYYGAEAAWKKAESINSKNPLAIANRANLYKAFLHRFYESEKLYLQAIALNKTAEPYFPDYEGLADLYQNYWQDKKSKVESLMLSAIDKAFDPLNKARFYLFLANYMRSTDPAKFEMYRAETIKYDPSLSSQF